MSNDMMTPDLVRLGVTVDGDKHAVIAKMAEVIASTGRAEKAGEAALREHCVNVAQHGDGAEAFGDVLDGNCCHLGAPGLAKRAKIRIAVIEPSKSRVEMALISGVKPLRIAE